MFNLNGVYPAMLTPFNDDLSLNIAEIKRLVRSHIELGLDGLFPVSSVGESVHLTFEEKKRYMDVVVEAADGRVPVTPGVASSHPGDCIALAHHAKEIGCQAVVVTPPYFYRPSPDMVDEFFQEIIEKAGLPVILYNIPLFTQPLSYAQVARLTQSPKVYGLKDSSGSMVDFLHFKSMIQANQSQASLFTGREEMLLPCLFMGGQGCMTATAAVLPEIMSQILKSFKSGDMKKAQELQESVLEPIRLMFEVPLPIGFKLALDLRGFHMGPCRLPLSAIEKEKVARLKPLLQQSLSQALNKFGYELQVA